MNRKDMWQIAKGIKAGDAPFEYAWGIGVGDIENEADVAKLRSLGWQGNKESMEYRDGLYLYGLDRATPITDEEDEAAADIIRRGNASYDRLDEMTGYES